MSPNTKNVNLNELTERRCESTFEQLLGIAQLIQVDKVIGSYVLWSVCCHDTQRATVIQASVSVIDKATLDQFCF